MRKRRTGRTGSGGRWTAGRWTSIGAAVLATTLTGCASDAESAQEQSVVPSDAQVAGERADRGRARGAEDAPVSIVEVSDFQCPFCRQFYDEAYRKIDSAYVQTGRARYLWISYANPGHGRAWPAIEASFCAGAVGRFWPMHDLLFERQEVWGASPDPFADFVAYAEELGIDRESFASCMRNSLLAPLMLRDYTSVMRAGISSTPYFILNDSVAIRGAADFETFRSAIDTLLVLYGDEAAVGSPEGAEAPDGEASNAEPGGTDGN